MKHPAKYRLPARAFSLILAASVAMSTLWAHAACICALGVGCASAASPAAPACACCGSKSHESDAVNHETAHESCCAKQTPPSVEEKHSSCCARHNDTAPAPGSAATVGASPCSCALSSDSGAPCFLAASSPSCSPPSA